MYERKNLSSYPPRSPRLTPRLLTGTVRSLCLFFEKSSTSLAEVFWHFLTPCKEGVTKMVAVRAAYARLPVGSQAIVADLELRDDIRTRWFQT